MNPMQKMRMMLARGILNLVSSATGLQIMQIDLLADETRDDVERVQNYGHSGHPPKGSTVAAVAIGGSRDHMVVVACEHPQYSPQLNVGEVAMYAMFGQLFKMDEEGNVTLKCKDFIVDADGSIEQKAKGSLSIAAAAGSQIEGGLNADTITADEIKEKEVRLGTHTHSQTMPGGGNSGQPNS